MRSAAKHHRRKTQREAVRERRQQDPVPATDEDIEVAFPLMQPAMDSQLNSPPASPISQGELDYTVVLTMVQKINDQLGDMHDKIRSVCDGLLRDYQLRDEAITNLTRLVKEAVHRPATHLLHQDTTGPHAMVHINDGAEN